MVNKQFEAYKLKREIKRSGTEYEFQRMGVNKFGEPSGEYEAVATVKGIYHEQNSNVQITTGDTTQVRTEKIPMILCLYEDLYDGATQLVKAEDLLFINGKKFVVQGIVNVQEWNIIGDISLEVVDNGVQD